MKTVAFLTSAEGVEQAELAEPWHAVKDAGHQPVLIADSDDGDVQAYQHLDKADVFHADLTPGQADPADYAVLAAGRRRER